MLSLRMRNCGGVTTPREITVESLSEFVRYLIEKYNTRYINAIVLENEISKRFGTTTHTITAYRNYLKLAGLIRKRIMYELLPNGGE